MEMTKTTGQRLQHLAGISGIVAGLSVISFAGISQSMGFLFTPEILSGGSIEPWMAAIKGNAPLARMLPVLPVMGFSAMLVVGLVLYQLTEEKSWQKNLALAGYLIGVPVVVSTFVSHLSLINQLITLSSSGLGLNDQVQVLAAFHLHHFMIINYAIGPLFIILLVNCSIAWAALKAGLLAQWLCYWAFFNGGLILLGIFSVFVPVLAFGQSGGPLTMLWFITTGIVLLRKQMAK